MILTMVDWAAWHALYDDPSSFLNVRLRHVRQHLTEAIGSALGPLRLVSLCAGQGRDVLGVLADHPRRDNIHAVLVESDPRNAEEARQAVARAGLRQVEVRETDAATVAGFADMLPADVLLLCGIFGNISDEDIKFTVQAASSMCRPGGTVIWTRHRRPPDVTPRIRAWFAESGFDEVAFDVLNTSDRLMGVGANRLRRVGAAGLPDRPLFTFRSLALALRLAGVNKLGFGEGRHGDGMSGLCPQPVEKERQVPPPGLGRESRGFPDHLRDRPRQGDQVRQLEVLAQLPAVVSPADDLLRVPEASPAGIGHLGA
jgi:hypothetical protein